MSSSEKFIDIIERLATTFLLFDENIPSYLREFKDFYEKQNRHDYSDISQFVFENNSDEETLELLEINLDKIIDFSTDELLNAHLKKLLDHAKLAKIQKQYTDSQVKPLIRILLSVEDIVRDSTKLQERLGKSHDDLLKIATELSKTSDDIIEHRIDVEMHRVDIQRHQEEIKKHKRDIEEIKSIKNQIYTQFVTILGVFTTIVFASFGGLEVLRNVMGNITEATPGKVLMFSSLVIATIISLLFVLLTGIARLTDRNMRSCGCDSNSTERCKHTVIQKYPTISLLLLINLFAFIVGTTSLFIDYDKLYSSAVGHVTDQSLLWGVLIFLASVFGLLATYYGIGYFKKPKIETD